MILKTMILIESRFLSINGKPLPDSSVKLSVWLDAKIIMLSVASRKPGDEPGEIYLDKSNARILAEALIRYSEGF